MINEKTKQNEQKTGNDSAWSKPKYDTTKYNGYIESIMNIPKIQSDTQSTVITEGNKNYYYQRKLDKMSNRIRINADCSNKKNKRDLSMKFDGDNLYVYNHYITPQGDTLSSDTLKLKAYSGKNLDGKFSNTGKFDYSKEAQTKKSTGPIPEGKYWVNPQQIIYNKNDDYDYIPGFAEEIGNQASGVIGQVMGKKIGRWPGGTPSWGIGRIDINPKKVKVGNTERDSFTIHGGDYKGSAGCIDVVENDKVLFNYLEKYKNYTDSIPLTVDYSKIK
ncbi:MAG: DUF2778 domain-containing protein [Rikenellaceae bacterium]